MGDSDRSGPGAKRTIPVSKVVLVGLEEDYVQDAVRSTWVSSVGPYVERFEADFAAFVGTSRAVSVCNGTCALHLALRASDVGPGDEVIVPSLTFAATANAVIQAGARPVLVDCLPDHWNLDPDQVARAVSSKTRAVIPVHLFGHPCDMDRIMEIAGFHDLTVIEDAAEAHGASWGGRRTGAIGHIGCFSFFGNKVITTGEGGMCVTSSAELAERMRLLRNQGMTPGRRYWHEEPGFNYRLTNVAAALGVAQLAEIESVLSRRAALAAAYGEGVASIDGLEVVPPPNGGMAIDWLFCVLLREGSRGRRDEISARLADRGVETRPFFFPLHVMPAFEGSRRVGDLANAERFSASGLCLPLHLGLSEEDVERIVAILRESLAHEARTRRLACP